MATTDVLVEVDVEVEGALSNFAIASESIEEGREQVQRVLPDLTGIELHPAAAPVPMFAPPAEGEEWRISALEEFGSSETNEDLPSATQVVAAQVEEGALTALRERPGVHVWPNSPIFLYAIDCDPFQPGVSVDEIRDKLGVHEVWRTGARGADVVVGLLDQGIDGSVYPVAGGYSQAGAQQPGAGSITSHGSMCAADVLVAAPDARLYDYPFMAQNSGGALAMLNAVLEHRRQDGAPHVLSNSWGYYAVPPRDQQPGHEIWDLQHPLHRKVREVVTSGAAVVFAAGNCGDPCPTGQCDASSIGPGKSIHGANSLAEVTTVAAVNSQDQRIGYSSQGEGMFEREKPDVAAYSHFFGNFGAGRPGGDRNAPFDSGTSAACPVVAGVLALLSSAHPGLTPGKLRAAIVDSAVGQGGWNPDLGHGIVSAAASYASLQ